MTVNNITATQTGKAVIYFSNGSEVETNLDSTCINTLNTEQYNALIQYIEDEPDNYFSVLNEIKNLI